MLALLQMSWKLYSALCEFLQLKLTWIATKISKVKGRDRFALTELNELGSVDGSANADSFGFPFPKY